MKICWSWFLKGQSVWETNRRLAHFICMTKCVLNLKMSFSEWQFAPASVPTLIQYPVLPCNRMLVLSICFNSLRPNDAYIRRQPRPSSVQIMACHLFGNKPLSEPMLSFSQLDPWEQISVKSKSKFKYFHWRKCSWQCRLPNGGHFVWPSMC